jgi:hypothetical protein
VQNLVLESGECAVYVGLLGRDGLRTDVDVAGNGPVVLGLELAVGGECDRVADVAVLGAY